MAEGLGVFPLEPPATSRAGLTGPHDGPKTTPVTVGRAAASKNVAGDKDGGEDGYKWRMR